MGKIGSEADHTPEAIARRLAVGPKHSYLRDWVYGGIDGAVTTFAVVSGVVGAHLPLKTILILGVANLIADGFSMAAGNFLSTKAEHDELKHYEAREREEIHHAPDGEREEVRQMFRKKGFKGEDLERAVQTVTSDPAQWVQIMLTEEHGLPLSVRSPWIAAISTFCAFFACGLVPLLPFLAKINSAFPFSIAATSAVFFAIGSLKSRWSITPWWRSGLITTFVGMGAAILSYGIGVLLKSVVE